MINETEGVETKQVPWSALAAYVNHKYNVEA